MKLELVTRDHFLDRLPQENVLPIVVELHHALQQHRPDALGLIAELARPGEDRLDVSGSRLLARNLGDVDTEVQGQYLLVLCPKLAEVEML